MRLTVAKVGGSLFDLPDMRERLNGWIGSVGGPVLLVPGGGGGADVIRRLDRLHRIGEETAHWLALRVLSVNAHFLAALVDAPVSDRADSSPSVAVLDPHAFCAADDDRQDAMEHRWDVTSDAIAARVAETAGGDLVLLKSVDLPADTGWAAAAEQGLVDAVFDRIVRRANLKVTWINLRRPTLP